MSLEFDGTKGLIIVPTRLWGPTGDTVIRLALDTGATGTMINWDILVMLGYDPAATPNRIQMTTGSGVEFVPVLSVQKIQAMRITHDLFSILCHTLPPSATVDGVLGLDFFRGKKLSIDFCQGKVEIE